ncbi:SRPBCC family protein [Pinirhizobacter soli]|uniref:SRPBCC family protein n=1 Tax=Pinirhizobacter soli TaxID=2786953 RepID=UPI00202AAA2B|nr:SRPBCC family protein [Pinirhizobacter soli]
MTENTDRVERQIQLTAPRSRVWQALIEPKAFGEWFGVALQGEAFVEGEPARGRITIPGYEHLKFEFLVACIEPERRFGFRWHPYAVDPEKNYDDEPTTLVMFELEDSPGGTLLRVVESGFDAIPVERRAEAFRMNSHGWEEQMGNIQRHVATH